MNRDMLHEFVMIAHKQHGELHKHTETEQIECWCWLDKDWNSSNEQYDKLHDKVTKWIKENGYILDEPAARELFEGYLCIQKVFFTITYDKLKDKISLSQFSIGYHYGWNRKRIYFRRKNTPLLCFSKHIYAFYQGRVGKRWKYQPRIYNGVYYQNWMKEYLCRALNCTEEVAQLWVSHRYMKDEITQWMTFNNRYIVASRYIMDKLGIKDNYNYLIQSGGKQTRELCQILRYRLDEGVAWKDTNQLIQSVQSFLREDLKPYKQSNTNQII